MRKAYQLVSGVLGSAVRDRRLVRNPAEGIPLPQLERAEQRFLSVDDIHDLADAIDQRYGVMVLLGGYAGLRFGELAALRVSSFSVGFRTVTVTETLTDVRGVVRIGPPKTRASIRTVACRRSWPTKYRFLSRSPGQRLREPIIRPSSSPPQKGARSARRIGGDGYGLPR